MQNGTLAEVQRAKKVNEIYKQEKDRGGSCIAELDVLCTVRFQLSGFV
jgi:hypothetical protein